MKVTKAVIPAAGLGTRVLPATKSMPKEMLTIVDKPAIQYIVEEAVNSGITDILIITNRGKGVIEDHFDRSPELEERLLASGKKDVYEEVVSISKLANIFFIRQKETKGLGSKYVFPGLKDPNKPIDNIRKAFEWALKQAELPHMRIHDLRHSFITMGANMGENMNALKDAAGHSRLATTEHYTHYASEQTFKAVNHITEAICE